MRRTLLIGALLTALLLLVSACGGETATEGASEPAAGASAAEESAGSESAAGGSETAAGSEGSGSAGGASESEAGASAGASEETAGSGSCTLDAAVPVGVVFSQTAGAAVYGTTQLNGVQLAVDQINAEDGVTYELVVEDDASVPEQGISAFETLLSQDVSVIMGPTLSNTAFSTDPIAQEAGVPVLGVSNTASGITEIGDYIYRDSLTEAQVIPQTIAAAKEQLGLGTVGVLYGDDDAFTQSGYDVFVEALGSEGIEIASTQTFAKGDTDFSAQLTEAAGSNPDALVVSALAEEASLIIEQARGLGIDAPIIGGNGFNSPALIENAGEAAEGVIVGAAWNSASDTPSNQEFQSAYEEAYGGAPDQFAAQAYTGMQLIDEAVRASCSAAPDDIRDGLAGISGVETVLGEFSFTEGRDADHPAVVQIVDGGAFTVLE